MLRISGSVRVLGKVIAEVLKQQASIISTEFDSLYDINFTLDSGTNANTQPEESNPSKSTSILQGGYTDATYLTEIRRISDFSDVADSITSMRHDYSRRNPWNCDSSKYLLNASNGFWYVYDAETLDVIPGGRTLTPGFNALNGLGGACEPIWHPTDPNKLWYTATNGSLVWSEFDLTTNTSSTLFDLSSLITSQTSITNAARAWFRGEGRPSNDGRWWALLIEDSAFNVRGLIMYDRVNNEITGSTVLTSNKPDHISTSPLGNYAVVSWYGSAASSLAEEEARAITSAAGVRAYNRTFTNFNVMSVLGEHSDLAIDANNNEYFVSVTYRGFADDATDGGIYARRLDNPEIRYNLPINVYEGSTGQAIHISGLAKDRPGWVVVSKYSGVGSGPYDGAVFAAEITPVSPRVFRLAHHRSAVSSYFAEPHATTNNDLTRVMFASDFGATNIYAYQILLPSYAFPAAGEYAPVATTAPTISGQATQDGVLTRTLGQYSANPAATVSGEWQESINSGGSWSTVGTGSTFTISNSAANGTQYRWSEAATNTYGNAQQVSNVLTVAELSAPTNTVIPSISPSNPTTSNTLTASIGTWTGNPSPSYSYEWFKDSATTGITTSTLETPTVGDYFVRVTATNSQGSVSADSAEVTVAEEITGVDLDNEIDFTLLSDVSLNTVAPFDDPDAGDAANYSIISGTLRADNNGYVEDIVRIISSQDASAQGIELQRAVSTIDTFATLYMYVNNTDSNFGYECRITSTVIQVYKNGSYLDQVAHGLNLSAQAIQFRLTALNGIVEVFATPTNDFSTPLYTYDDSAAALSAGYPAFALYNNGDNTRNQITSILHS